MAVETWMQSGFLLFLGIAQHDFLMGGEPFLFWVVPRDLKTGNQRNTEDDGTHLKTVSLFDFYFILFLYVYMCAMGSGRYILRRFFSTYTTCVL